MLPDTKSSVQHRPHRHFQPSGNFVSHSEFHWGIHVTLQRNASVVLVISRSGLANTAIVDLVLEWDSLPLTNKYWPRESFTDLKYPQAYPFPVLNIIRLSSTQFPYKKRIKKVFFSQLNKTSSGVYKVTNLMNNSRKVQSNECVYTVQSPIRYPWPRSLKEARHVLTHRPLWHPIGILSWFIAKDEYRFKQHSSLLDPYFFWKE